MLKLGSSMVFVERQRWRQSPREIRKGQKMAFRRTQYYDIFRKKAVTVHVENVTIEWLKDDDVIKIYFPKSTHPEFGKIGNEFHFWTSKVSSWTSRTNFGASKINYWASKTKVVIITNVTSEDDTPQLQKADNGQTVFTMHIGASTLDGVSRFTLKVNNFAARFNTFTMCADGLNWLFDYEECDEGATVIVMPYNTRIQLINLREGDRFPFPGANNFVYEVGVVSLILLRREGRVEVMVYDYENGLHAYHNYSVFGHPNSWFVPSIPPRSQL